MCEHCGCRRVPEIAALGLQHELIEDLAAAVMDVVNADPTQLAGAALALREAIVPHAEREESGIFEVARTAGLAGYYVDDLEEDHQRFADQLSRVEELDRETLEQLIDDLIRHIALEEYELFPAAADILDRQPSAVP